MTLSCKFSLLFYVFETSTQKSDNEIPGTFETNAWKDHTSFNIQETMYRNNMRHILLLIFFVKMQ